jgi:hypothetical protein
LGWVAVFFGLSARDRESRFRLVSKTRDRLENCACRLRSRSHLVYHTRANRKQHTGNQIDATMIFAIAIPAAVFENYKVINVVRRFRFLANVQSAVAFRLTVLLCEQLFALGSTICQAR